MSGAGGPAGVRRHAVLVATSPAMLTLAACGSGEPSSLPGLRSPAGTYRADDGAQGEVMDILPAGGNGLVNASEYAAYAAHGSRPLASDDQIKPCNDLIYGANQLTDGNLRDYYLDESFGSGRPTW
jgi:hypothetical protein